jgi:ATP-binding cassette subfamily B protein
MIIKLFSIITIKKAGDAICYIFVAFSNLTGSMANTAQGKEVSLLEFHYRKSNPFKALWKIFHFERKNLIISLLLLTIKHSPALFLPIIIGNVINAISLKGEDAFQSILVNSIFILILLIQNIFTHTYFVKYLSKANRSVEHNLRYALVKRMQELSIAFHHNFESGRLQTKVLRDAESVEMLSRQLVNTVFIGILNVSFALVATILYSWQVALFFLLTIPMSVIITKIFQKRMAVTNKEYRKQLENMSARVGEMVQMIPIARAHAVEETEIQQMGRQFQKVKGKGMKLDVINALFGASSWASFQIFQFLCLLVTAYMAFKGLIVVGDVVMFQGFFAMIINSVNSIINVFPELNRGIDSIHSLGEILECPDIEVNEGKEMVTQVEGKFKFKNVNFFYNADDVTLKNINLEVEPGECVAFVGESGSGKSTLMNLIIGYRRPTAGEIILDGVDMQEMDLRTYRRFLAVVPQNTLLFSGSIRENILYGLERSDVSDDELQNIIHMAKLDVVIDQLPDGIDTLIGEHGDKLSGGQRQRIAIARAMIRNPKVIIFDEATSALDVESEKHIQESVDIMIKGRTTFIVAHRLTTIKKANRIVVMQKGNIAEIGTPAELIAKKGIYAKMVAMQTNF